MNMTPGAKNSDRWQLSQWPKGVPYGSAPILSLEQAQAIRHFLLARIGRKTGKRDLLIFDLLLCTGCYVGELYNLKMSNLLYGSDETRIPIVREDIVFDNSKSNKIRKDRIIPVAGALRKSIEENADISRNWVCWSQIRTDDSRMDKIHLTYLVHSWGKSCGMKIRAHSFRKTFMTQLFEKGADIETMLRLSGHKSIQSLAQYLKNVPAERGKAVDLFPSVYSGQNSESMEIKKVS